MPLSQFILDSIQEWMRDNKGQRYGQFMFNRLYAYRPDIADATRGTICDPFYANDNNDIRVHRFWAAVEQYWND